MLRTQLGGAKVLAAATDVLPLGTLRRGGHRARPRPPTRTGSSTAAGDPWWDGVDFGRRLEHVPPASLIGGWYDLFLPAQVADYEALRRAGRSARLTVGPWTHSSPGLFGETVRDGLRVVRRAARPSARAERQARRCACSSWGRARGRSSPLWPPAGETQRWYLGRWGTLSTEPPAESAPDRFHYNPHDPTPAVGGASLNVHSAGRKDQRRREHRHDVLTYTSPVLTEDLTVIGPLTAELYLRSSLEHTDFFVRLCDVSEKGRSFNISDGIVRLEPGSVHREEDGVFRLEIAMWPTANTFLAGHRLRLQVSSGAHPLFCRNTGTGEPLATATTMRSADQEVFHDAARPSSIALPVVRLLADQPLGEGAGMGAGGTLG